jgi:hypothetical protein
MLISLAFVFLARRLSLGLLTSGFGWADLAFLFLAGVFFAGSRDTLRNYYARTSPLLSAKGRTRKTKPTAHRSDPVSSATPLTVDRHSQDAPAVIETAKTLSVSRE